MRQQFTPTDSKRLTSWQLTKQLLGLALILVLGLAPQVARAAPGDVAQVSVSSAGVRGNALSDYSAISADGNFVAFISSATNLVSGDTNGAPDIFVRDRSNSATTRVSVASDGTQANGFSTSPAISGDGRYVAFASAATNLVSGDTNGLKDLFVHDRQTGVTTRVSVDSSGAQADDLSDGPSLSSDGRYIAFWSKATNLVSGDTNGYPDVFVHDRQTGTTERISTNSGAQVNGASVDPSISSDGRYVVFASLASALVSGDTNNTQDIFVHDRQTGMTTRVSVDSSGGEANGSSDAPAVISSDGRYVAFESDATNLVSGDTNGTTDIFVHDRQTGTTTLVSVANNGTKGNDRSLNPSMSSDGRYIAFESLATNLVSGDTNSSSDVFLHDQQSGKTWRISVYSNGGQTSSDSLAAALSGNGQFASFYSFDDGLVGATTDGIADVYITEPALINSAPTATNDSYSTVMNTPLIIAAPGVLSNDSDADGDTLTVMLTGTEPMGGVTLHSDGSFTYTPVTGFTGVDAFYYKANDGLADSDEATVLITIGAACPAFPITVTDEASLNEAIACYNAITTVGTYVVNINADITLSEPTTAITNSSANVSLQINGNDHVIDGANSYRHFTILDSTVTIADLTLPNGHALEDCGDLNLPAPDCGGAIKVKGPAVVTVNNTTVMGSTATVGGGIFNEAGTITLNNSTISNSSSAYRGGGVGNSGGVMTLINTSVLNNTSYYNAGISNEDDGNLTLRASTIANNHADFGGGGLYNEYGSVTLSNSTISGNHAMVGPFGGVRNSNGSMVITNSTIVNNSAGDANGGLSTAGNTLTVRNTIIANNSDSDCVGVDPSDVDATNLASDGTCGAAVQSANINLGPLQDNGGPTWTHALLPGSAAINAGYDTICAAAPVNNVDQRGVSRPQGVSCDVGAFEAEDSGNLLQNPGFEAGTEGWKFWTDGAGSFTTESPGYTGNLAARVDISSTGDNIQLYQKGFLLEDKTWYKLSFAAKSSSGHDVAVYVHQHKDPYTNYGLRNFLVDLTSNWNEFSITFRTKNINKKTTDTRMRLWLKPYVAAGDTYWFDSMSLIKVQSGNSAAALPSGQAGAITGQVQLPVGLTTAVVKLVDMETEGLNYISYVQTDGAGIYRFDNLPYGNYQVAVDAPAGYLAGEPVQLAVDAHGHDAIELTLTAQTNMLYLPFVQR